MICRNHVDVSEGVVACTRCGASFCPDCVVAIHGRPYCATCKSEKLLDVQSGTDYGALAFATIGRRFAAVIIDSMLFFFTGMGTMLVGALFVGANKDLFIIPVLLGFGIIILGLIVYEALMLGARGQTLGKIALKIKVVRPDGTPITRGQAWGRALLRGVMVHVLTLLNYIPALVTKERTCVHDLVANTRVVSID